MNNLLEQKYINNLVFNIDTFSNELFFEGKICVSKELLDVVCKTNKMIMVYTKNINNNMINRYQSQYNNTTLVHHLKI